jgi:hypothetical protein
MIGLQVPATQSSPLAQSPLPVHIFRTTRVTHWAM